MSESPRSVRPLFARMALLLATCALIGVFGEIAARLVAHRSVAPEEDLDPDLPVFDALADLRRPSWEGIYKGVYHRSNAQSMRGPEIQPLAVPGVFRIAVVGDSITMGQGVPEWASYPSLLADRLNGSGLARFEVLNVGISGANTVSSAKRLSRTAQLFSPDYAIYGFTINDIEGPRYEQRYKRQTARKIRTMVKWGEASRYDDSPSYLLRWLWPRWVLLRGFDDLEIGLVDRQLEHNYFENPEAWAGMMDGLDEMVALTRQRGICLVVFMHTHLAELTEQHAYTRVYERVMEAARERGLPVIESFPAFAGRDETRLWVSRTDSHPNIEGQRILADALYAGLRGLDPPCDLDL